MKRTLAPIVHGWLILNKPQGLTSTQALGKVRRLLNGSKAGHGGTLDPLATGVLPLAFGEATKLIPYVMDGDKEYAFTVRWGEARDTADAEGQVIATSPNRPTAGAIQAALSSFLGQILQRPPAYSAIKVDGERAYDLARAGEEVVLEERPVFIERLDLTRIIDADHAAFLVKCSKGTYVRALATDLAAALGTCGHVTELTRLAAGPFRIEDAVTLGDLEAAASAGHASTLLLPIKMALGSVPVLVLTAAEAQQLYQGQALTIRPHHGSLVFDGPVLTEHQGLPVAVVEAFAGTLRVVRGFRF